jgi:hypothetical protein
LADCPAFRSIGLVDRCRVLGSLDADDDVLPDVLLDQEDQVLAVITLSLNHGGRDNITVVVADVQA